MASKRDYYEVLGVDSSASNREIAAAYRKLAIEYHPDSNPGDADATERFKEAAEAYEVLSDQTKRSRYDRHGHAGLEGGAATFTDVEDIFEAFGDIFGGGIFGEMFGTRRRGGRRERRGGDLKCHLTLDLEEAAKGVTKTVQFDRSQKCDQCNGSGSRPGSQPQKCHRCGGRGQVVQSAGILRVQTTCPSCHGRGNVIADPCTKCRGNGYISQRMKMDVAIPAGVDNGIRIRLTGEGEPSPDGGPPGDCYCFISVHDHPLFQRDGAHLIVRLPITYPQAALGAVVQVPTLSGPDELTIPAGSQSGDVFRLKGRGMPDPHGRGVGDLLVQTNIEVPKIMSPTQEKLLRELAEEDHSHVSPQRKSFLKKLKSYFAPSEHSTEPSED